MVYLLVFAGGFLLALGLTPTAARLGQRLGLLDRPGGRRRHRGAVPRTGGLALFGAFMAVILATLLLPQLFPATASWFPPRNDPNELRRLVALLAGSTFCAAVGFLDDRFEFSPGPQYLAQLTAAAMAIGGLIFIKHVNNPLGADFLGGPDGLPWWLVGPVTVFWFMGMMNTVNWLDGLDGLVAGVTAIFCTILAVHMLFVVDPPQESVALLPVALLGVVLGFLPFNFAPARVFMGSSGSYFLGFALAALGIIGGARLATVLLVLGLPILDVAWLIVQRWRRGISPGQGGRDHLHYRLQEKGLSERSIVLGYWLFCAVFGGLTLVLDSRLYKLVALLGLGALGLFVLAWAHHPTTRFSHRHDPDLRHRDEL